MKYPTFAPASPKQTFVPVTNEKLAEGTKPIPARSNFHATEQPDSNPLGNAGHTGPGAAQPLPGTPAPSPPPSPAPGPQNARVKKMQFQTDPTRPFVFPYSHSTANGASSLVPFAISEADKLYHQHAYVSLGLYQMYETREELLREERGLGKSGLIGFDALKLDEEDEYEEAWETMKLEWRFDEEAKACLEKGDKEGARKAAEKVASARRLQRVELIYVSAAWLILTCRLMCDAEKDAADHAELRDRPAQAFASDSDWTWRAKHGGAERGPSCWFPVAGAGTASSVPYRLRRFC